MLDASAWIEAGGAERYIQGLGIEQRGFGVYWYRPSYPPYCQRVVVAQSYRADSQVWREGDVIKCAPESYGGLWLASLLLGRLHADFVFFEEGVNVEDVLCRYELGVSFCLGWEQCAVVTRRWEDEREQVRRLQALLGWLWPITCERGVLPTKHQILLPTGVINGQVNLEWIQETVRALERMGYWTLLPPLPGERMLCDMF